MESSVLLIKSTDPCKPEAGKDFYSILLNQLIEHGLSDKIQAVRTADIGIYNQGMVVKVLPANIVYANLLEKDIPALINALKTDTVLEEFRFKGPISKQNRLVLRNCGVIDPGSIEEYLDKGGYQGLKRALFELTPEKVIEEMKVSGLRGRGGAGFPTWLKWKLTRDATGDRKFVICNGDEGDPGAYMDRSVLEGDPHAVLEGLLIGAYAIGSSQGYFYIRAEYPLAVARIEKAIEQAKGIGLLGKNILGSGFSFDAEIRLGAGAFVCGEETSLIASIEGKRGTPRPRPPYPSVHGLWGMPTSINNVESFANVAAIFQFGAESYAKTGTEKSRGTKVFALTGKVRNSGLIEVPMGITLREIIFDIGGGLASCKLIKAVQTGGPSGGVIPERFLDTPVEYETLQKLGSFMGSGGMIVMDEDDCMVDVSKFYMKFCVEESCGKCAPCRIGTYQLHHLLEKISEGRGELSDLDKLRTISIAMQKASLCGLGQGAPNPVISTLKYFEDEYREHIINKRCPSKKCKKLVIYTISLEKCKRCRKCVIECPVNAISGDREKGYVIDQKVCIKCGRCYEVCKFNAVSRA